MTQATKSSRATITTPSDREIRIERVFHATRERVWRALTDPALVAQWWGRGNKLVIERMEVRRGGHWRFVEHGPDGVHGFEGRYREVTPPERVVQTFEWDGMPGHVAVETMTLEDLGDGRTRMTTVSLFSTREERDGMLQSGMEGGVNQSHAALDKVLASTEGDARPVPVAIVAPRITPCLWFDTQAEEAARFYVSIFGASSIGSIARFTEEGREHHGKAPGSVMTVSFRLGGMEFLALNGGPQFKFSEAISFQIFCDTQAEIDHYWNRLTEGGQEQPCGWLKDRFGVSWQVVPTALPALLGGGDAVRAKRVSAEMFTQKKPDLAALERAARG